MTPSKSANRMGARFRRGSTLLEVAIAAVIIGIVALAGTSYYLYGRLYEIRAQQEQAAFNITELEIESWNAEGYGSCSGFVTPAVPYAYNFTWPVGDPRRVNYPRLEVREGMTYRISATSVFNIQGGPLDGYTSPVDYRWQDTAAGITWQYRRLRFLVEWGPGFGDQLFIETRVAQ